MPYALYKLFSDGELHSDFTTYSKTRVDVVSDAVKFLLAARAEKYFCADTCKQEVTAKSLEADLYLDVDALSKILADVEIKVVEVIGIEEEPIIDKAISTLEIIDRVSERPFLKADKVLALSRAKHNLQKALGVRFYQGFPELKEDVQEGFKVAIEHSIEQAMNVCSAN